MAILFGGKSPEHEVSIKSARYIVSEIDERKYDIVLVGIDLAGRWHLFDKSRFFAVEKLVLPNRRNDVDLIPYDSSGKFLAAEKIDVVFPVLHGSYGEDGTMQGLFELANVAFVGSGTLASALAMDKDVSKRLFQNAGLPVAKFITFRKCERNDISFAEVKKELGVPFFVKPASLGSSIGIAKVCSEKEFLSAVDEAFGYDNKILMEEYVRGKEIECSVLGNEEPIVSVCGEIVPQHKFYSYEAKYLDENGAVFSIPANVSEKVAKEIQSMSLKAYKALGCEGMARVDFFLTEKDEAIINEVNSIPGFTSISMYPKLWEAAGVSARELIDRLIESAMARFNDKNELRTSYRNN